MKKLVGRKDEVHLAEAPYVMFLRIMYVVGKQIYFKQFFF